MPGAHRVTRNFFHRHFKLNHLHLSARHHHIPHAHIAHFQGAFNDGKRIGIQQFALISGVE